MTYELLTNVDGATSLVRTNADGSQTWIPQDLGNADYQTYLLTPVAVTPLSAEQLAQQATEKAQVTAQAASTTNLQALIGGMGALITQAQTDLVTLAASTDPLAVIVARSIQGVLALTQGLTDALIVLNAVEASQIPNV